MVFQNPLLFVKNRHAQNKQNLQKHPFFWLLEAFFFYPEKSRLFSILFPFPARQISIFFSLASCLGKNKTEHLKQFQQKWKLALQDQFLLNWHLAVYS